MLFIFRQGGQLETGKGDYGGRGVCQVVDAVGDDRDAAAENPDQNFGDAEQCIGNDADNTGEFSVTLANVCVFGILIVLDENFTQKIVHFYLRPSYSADWDSAFFMASSKALTS